MDCVFKGGYSHGHRCEETDYRGRPCPILPRCRFCGGRDGLQLCAWPEKKAAKVTAADVVAGDTVLDLCVSRPGKARGPWSVIDVQQHGKSVTLVLRIRTTESCASIMFTYDVVLVERLAPCGAPACDLHLQERAPGQVVCRDHWRAWEAVA